MNWTRVQIENRLRKHGHEPHEDLLPRESASSSKDRTSVLVRRKRKPSKRTSYQARLAEALRSQTETLKSVYGELEGVTAEQLQFLRNRIFHAELACLKATMQKTSTEQRQMTKKAAKKGKPDASPARRRKKRMHKAGAEK